MKIREIISNWIRCVVIACILLSVITHYSYGQEKTILKESNEHTKSNHTALDAGDRKREMWIREKVKEVGVWSKVSEDTLCVKPQVTRYEDIREVSYRIVDQGSVRCENGDIIRILLHSSHTDKEIGDIALGIDNHNRVFLNVGHVCGGIVHFESKDDILPASADDFFARFISDTDDEKWSPWLGN